MFEKYAKGNGALTNYRIRLTGKHVNKLYDNDLLKNIISADGLHEAITKKILKKGSNDNISELHSPGKFDC